jgi:hypothetical protein
MRVPGLLAWFSAGVGWHGSLAMFFPPKALRFDDTASGGKILAAPLTHSAEREIPRCTLAAAGQNVLLSLSIKGRTSIVLQYSSTVATPFAVLTAVVAPAILTNASSVLALGTSNRLARVVDRTRIVTAERTQFEPGTPDYQSWSPQLPRLQVRVNFLVKALRLFYAHGHVLTAPR